MGQEHDRVGAYSWAFTDSMHGRADKGPGTYGEPGWHGTWNMQQFGLLLPRNWSHGNVGVFAAERAAGPDTGLNWVLDNELGFRIERRVDGGNWITIAYRPMSNLLKTVTEVQDPLEIHAPSGNLLVAEPTMIAELNPQAWVDYLAPVASASSIEYRVIAMNSADDLSTGVSAAAAVDLGAPPVAPLPPAICCKCSPAKRTAWPFRRPEATSTRSGAPPTSECGPVPSPRLWVTAPK